MNKEFRDWLESEIQYLEDFEYANVVEFRILRKLERTIKKYDELHKPVVIPEYVAEYLEFAKKGSSLIQVMETASVIGGWPTMKKVFDWISANDETFARAWLYGYEVEEELLYYALLKGHELIDDEGDLTCKYWNIDTSNDGIFPSDRDSKYGRYLTRISKAEWNELGINDSNADFVKADE